MISKSLKSFILAHRQDDVRKLALKFNANNINAGKKSNVSNNTNVGNNANVSNNANDSNNEGTFDLSFALDQIQGWQTARQKLPTWASNDDLVYPPHLNMEQCSSEATARYKTKVLASLLGDDMAQSTLIDLTGGFGVDFSFMSEKFGRGIYVEQNAQLCDMIRHNMKVMSRLNVEINCGDGVEYLNNVGSSCSTNTANTANTANAANTSNDTNSSNSASSQLNNKTTDLPGNQYTVIYLDPARRDTHGRKVAALTDCHPDITLLRDELLAKADIVMVKLSPMLDIHSALSAMCPNGQGASVHIVCSQGECKELLLVLTHLATPLRMVCVDDDNLFEYCIGEDELSSFIPTYCKDISDISGTLLVPHAGIMKAQCFNELSKRFSICKISKTSHLFVAVRPIEGFPGRQFRIIRTTTMNKRELQKSLAGISQANIAVRNFPLTSEQLRKKLKLKDGGSCYIFATTLGKTHVLIIADRQP